MLVNEKVYGILEYLINHNAATIKKLTEYLGCTYKTTENYVGFLFEKGLIIMNKWEHDKRYKYIQITPKGREIFTKMQELII